MWTDTASTFWGKWNFLNCRGGHPQKKKKKTRDHNGTTQIRQFVPWQQEDFVYRSASPASCLLPSHHHSSGGIKWWKRGSKLGKGMQYMVLLHPLWWEVPLPLLMRQFPVKYLPSMQDHFQAPTGQSQNDCPVCHQDSARQMEGDTQVTTTTDGSIRESEVVGWGRRMRKTPMETVCTEVKNKNNSWMKRFCFWLFYLDTKKKNTFLLVKNLGC